MIDNLSITVHTFPLRMQKSLSIDEIFLLRYVKGSTNLKNVICCFEQILKKVPYKTAAVQPLISHLKTNKTCWELQEGLEQTHKRPFLISTYT